MPTIEANGIVIYYEEQGTGPALLLIQGLTYATPMWHWQMVDLQKHCRVVAFDNRGSGKSSKPDEPYSIPLFAKDALALMDALKIERAAVLGISMGGLIAQEVALAYPGRVSHLILCATLYGGITATQPTPETLAYLMQYQEQVGDEISRLEIAYGTAAGFSERHPDRVSKLAEFKRQTRPPKHAYFHQLMSSVGYSSEDRLRTLTIPTLILAGKQDRIIPPQNSERLHAIIPNSQIRVFEDAGHHLHIEEPEAFNQAVLDFVRG
jgi:pimeloyl-ACP methyl ester carboxylesterase